MNHEPRTQVTDAIVRYFMAKGADVNARNNINGSALMLAAQMGDAGAVKLLLEKGADARLRC